jgi:hypothetical protein
MHREPDGLRQAIRRFGGARGWEQKGVLGPGPEGRAYRAIHCSRTGLHNLSAKGDVSCMALPV